jgi:hypothetical protein
MLPSTAPCTLSKTTSQVTPALLRSLSTPPPLISLQQYTNNSTLAINEHTSLVYISLFNNAIKHIRPQSPETWAFRPLLCHTISSLDGSISTYEGLTTWEFLLLYIFAASFLPLIWSSCSSLRRGLCKRCIGGKRCVFCCRDDVGQGR